MFKSTGFAVFALCWSVGVSAQTAAAGPSDCELHFWGSDKAQTSNYSGVGGMLGEALAGPRPQSEESLLADLPNDAQAEALTHVDLASIFKVSSMHVIRETGPLPGKPGKSGPRLTSSTAPCYAELIVDYIGYTSHITAGRKFGARFWLRRYPTADGPAAVQNGGVDVKVRLYPAKPGEDRQAALAELGKAFEATVSKFLVSKLR